MKSRLCRLGWHRLGPARFRQLPDAALPTVRGVLVSRTCTRPGCTYTRITSDYLTVKL